MTAAFRITQDAVVGEYGIARQDLTVYSVGGSVTLEAEDQTGESSDYVWEVLSEPEGSSVSIVTPVPAAPWLVTVDLLVTGGYLFRLTFKPGTVDEDIQVLYLGIPLTNSGLCIPASNETVFDNSYAAGGSGDTYVGYERKLTALYKWIDTQVSGGGGTPGGADTEVQFNDGGSFGGAEVYYDSTSGNLGMRNPAPYFDLDIANNPSMGLLFGGTNLALRTYGVANQSPHLLLMKANGVAATPAALASGDAIGSLEWVGAFDSGIWDAHNCARFAVTAAEDFTAGTAGVNAVLYLAAVGGNTPTAHTTFHNAGDLQLGSGGILVGAYQDTAAAGAIEWDGSNFKGYTGSAWVNLDTQGGTDVTLAASATTGGMSIVGQEIGNQAAMATSVGAAVTDIGPVSGTLYRLRKITWSGTTWWATGDADNQIFRYDGGTTWTTITNASETSSGDYTYHTQFDGKIWTGVSANPASPHRVWSYDPDLDTWTGHGGDTESIIPYGFCEWDGSFVVSSFNGTVYKWDTGTTWTYLGDTGSARAMSPTVSGGELYVITNTGLVYKYAGTGTTWNDLSFPQDAKCIADWDGVPVVGCLNAGIPEVYKYEGAAWTQLGSDLSGDIHTQFEFLATDVDGNLCARPSGVATDPGYFYKYDAGTDSWSTALSETPSAEVWRSEFNPSNVVAYTVDSSDVHTFEDTHYDYQNGYLTGEDWLTFNNKASGSTFGGLVYINDVQPNGGGNVGTKVYTTGSDDNVLESCVSDDSSLRVYVIAMIGESNLRPSVTVNGTTVGNWNYTAYQDDNRVLFRGYADITLSGGGTITVTHEDGATATCTVADDPKPVISSVAFVNGYPGSQTELKAGDNFDVQVTADLAFVTVEVEDSGACDYQSEVVASTTTTTITTTIADRGTTNVARPARVRVQKSTGAWSDWVYTNAGGSVDGTNVVNCNNLYPSVATMNQASITYPATQEAIKGAETVTVACTCSDFDTISYTSPNSDLSIPSSTTYAASKAGVARIAGSYNIDTVNYRVSCNRAANDATTTEDLVVYIANVAATVTMTEASRLRSGGNDGTSVQSYDISLTANQNLRIAPTIAAPSANGGTWSGLFTGGPTVWTRTLQVHDSNDVPGTYSYQALSAYNLANIETTAYTGDSNYVIGGFVSRVIALAAFANEASFSAAVADYSKCTLSWTVKSLPNRRAYNTTATPDANSWCFAGTLGASPTTARILDTAATSSSSDITYITIEETE